ncbi:hypothetical protein [Maridesulfovibrio bastinii]|uniref:hypothetical protein n=1 Tax=Maridesulfovibrio bastinii TaxID=47157 RepID=UPI000414DAFB|nr:hypothetical protein [Maridesulfovibrio bastinii]
MRIPYIVMLAAILIFSAGCAQKKPVLYHNAHYNNTSPEQRDKDINYCIEQGKTNIGESSRGKTSLKSGIKGSVIGGAVGLGIGIITGSPGTSTAAGALGGGAGGAASGAFDDSGDALFRRYVNRCLQDKGYEPIGWK